MILSVGWFVAAPCDVDVVRQFADGLKANIHVSFYEKKDLAYVLAVSPYAERIHSVHLPKELKLEDFCEGGCVDVIADSLGVDLFVVHPWAVDLDEIVKEVMRREKYCLCLESFSLSRGRGSVMSLVEDYGKAMRTPYLGMCFDFSHIEPEMLAWPLVRGLMRYTKIFHVSRIDPKTGEKHSPINPNDSAGIYRILRQIYIYPADVREWVLEYDKKHEKMLGREYLDVNTHFEVFERIKKRQKQEKNDGEI